jgi:hypothetical protein
MKPVASLVSPKVFHWFSRLTQEKPTMLWRIENKHSGAGHDVEGDFDTAALDAQSQCTTDASRWVLWLQPGNIRVAEVTIRGCLWIKTELSGKGITSLMRRHRQTIEQLAFRMGLTQKRIRQVRERGLRDPNAVRDWIQAITDEDIGPLPERYLIRHITEETSCAYCGTPLDIGDHAYEYVSDIFCSVTCCRESRGWKAVQVA